MQGKLPQSNNTNQLTVLRERDNKKNKDTQKSKATSSPHRYGCNSRKDTWNYSTKQESNTRNTHTQQGRKTNNESTKKTF